MQRVFALLASVLFFSACGESREGQPRVAFITNCVADFWRIGEAGARAAGAEFGVEVDVRMPPNNDPFEQKQMVEDVLTRGAVGRGFPVVPGPPAAPWRGAGGWASARPWPARAGNTRGARAQPTPARATWGPR